MNVRAIIERLLRPRRLTRLRIVAAFFVALVADGLQFGLGPLGVVGLDQGIDLAAMVVEVWLIGFHWLLLPTFALELIPLVDLLPTWTGCVGLVVARRWHAQQSTGGEGIHSDLTPNPVGSAPPDLPPRIP